MIFIPIIWVLKMFFKTCASQLKHIFQLEAKVSSVMGQNSKLPKQTTI